MIEQRSYRVPRVARQGVMGVAALFGLPALYGVGYYALEISANPIPSWTMIIVCGGFFLACAYFAYSVQRWGAVLTSDAIFMRRWHYTRRLPYAEIAGWRLCRRPRIPPFLQLVSTDTSAKPITIDGGLVNQAELEAWARTYPDLTVDEEEVLREAVEQDAELGATPEERRASLAHGQKVTKVINGAGLIILGWAFYAPYPYDLAMILTALVPVAALWAVNKFKTIVAFEGRAKQSGEYGFTLIFMCTPAILAYRASRYVQFEYKPDDFIPVLVAALLFAAMALISAKKRRVSLLSHVFIFLGCFVYAFGVLSYLNVQLDRSEAEVVHTVVVAKSDYKGSKGPREYHVDVRGWPGLAPNETKRLEVSQSFYEIVEANQSACAYVRPGVLGMSWLVAGRCAAE